MISENKERITLTLKKENILKLEKIAEKENRNKSQVIDNFIEKYTIKDIE